MHALLSRLNPRIRQSNSVHVFPSQVGQSSFNLFPHSCSDLDDIDNPTELRPFLPNKLTEAVAFHAYTLLFQELPSLCFDEGSGFLPREQSREKWRELLEEIPKLKVLNTPIVLPAGVCHSCKKLEDGVV